RWNVPEERIRLEWLGDTIAPMPDATMRVEGSGSSSEWTVIIATPAGSPIRRRVRAGVDERVAVAAHALARDSELVADDIAWKMIVRWGPPRESKPAAPMAGWVTRRIIAAGEPLAEPAVAPAWAVKSGQEVSVVVRRGAMELRVHGIAQGSASVGQKVTVRLDVRRRVAGVVTAGGEVEVQN
ncbi:MAG: flagellar basal body P-ring formation chaperone FlgA, partial [Gemmatimonadota bacterium]|nr:flagellar basal body P-ring formation chaperone FlgA [Gemmatimonadota bacterium]